MSQAQIESADYGQPPPDNYEEVIKGRFAEILVDPTAPLYVIGKPRKGHTQRNSAFKTQDTFGWVVCGTVNSKNRMGGYTGAVPFFTLFRGEYVAAFIPGNSSRDSYLNEIITKACARAAFEP